MQIIPVVDLRHGVVVQAIAGRRAEYRPVSSCLTESACPLDVVNAIKAATGCRALYVADLDGILEQRPNLGVLRDIAGLGIELILDAGVKDLAGLAALRGTVGACRIVVATETWTDFSALFAHGIPQDVLVSLDLRSGLLQVVDHHYVGLSPQKLVAALVDAGLQEIIVLDVAMVGTGAGVRTLTLCQALKQCHSGLSVITGGGVHSAQCVQAARSAGVDGLLIASALHDGRFQAWNLGKRPDNHPSEPRW